MRSFRKKKTQSIVEYSVAFVVVAVGVVGISFIGNAKGVFQNHFDEATNQINDDSGSSGEVDTSPDNLAHLIERGGEANYTQAEEGLKNDNTDQVAREVAKADDQASLASVMGSGGSEGFAEASPKEKYEATKEAYQQAETNLNDAKEGVKFAEKRKNKAKMKWLQAEDNYDYWNRRYERAKEHGWPSGWIDWLKNARDRARKKADRLKVSYEQAKDDYETAQEGLETSLKTYNQIEQEYQQAKEEYLG
ncbi:MAG: hypothetical protein K9L80_01570 [Candidatus Omnitrophica bacterium]|nr:hypothetical protein [Candidatus Omnitrophota bacterium]MCF7887489.1 hypothetical protein [Candidatus Omnitrophota bacterium]MCF7888048.1 hypothetical protein [Candidatus Omnitrophota bacterium]